VKFTKFKFKDQAYQIQSTRREQLQLGQNMSLVMNLITNLSESFILSWQNKEKYLSLTHDLRIGFFSYFEFFVWSVKLTWSCAQTNVFTCALLGFTNGFTLLALKLTCAQANKYNVNTYLCSCIFRFWLRIYAPFYLWCLFLGSFIMCFIKNKIKIVNTLE
jgi:hypothetical protein